ncbi:ATP-binding cassette domain-containing protein [Nocardia beijingensis]|uniref:ATP-binding cassette domain-containing protein n=1 Tax=Nocardia beijingensis TaxID=95162 RepID=UPI001894C36B|nr:ATP-binding cassette domain-containing protein [Nocardia beijingensis]MBF6468515.1 ATP-binding cassette domain-containing protein [Nocardia beijingensis]
MRVTFRAPAGRVAAVVGPSGAGKTALLSMLAGRLRPHRGQLRVQDADRAQRVPLRTRVPTRVVRLLL